LAERNRSRITIIIGAIVNLSGSDIDDQLPALGSDPRERSRRRVATVLGPGLGTLDKAELWNARSIPAFEFLSATWQIALSLSRTGSLISVRS
jgi:hypothetical protein